MDEQQKQTILDLPKVIAVGIASPVASVLTSRFGVAGTLIGLALSAVILTALADALKVYLARAPGTVTKMPGGFRSWLSWQNVRGRLKAAFSRASSLPPPSLSPARRRSILIGSLIAAGISFFVGLSVVTGLELGVGKSLSCWVWNECPEESSAEDGEASNTGTLPSIFGGGQSASSSPLQVEPSDDQPQPAPGDPEAPLQPLPDVPDSETPGPQAPGQRWSPSGIPEDRQQEDQQQRGDQQQSPSDTSEDQQPASSEE